MFNTFQSTESAGMAMHRLNQRKKAKQRREAEKKRLRIEQQRRDKKQHSVIFQLKVAQDIVDHYTIDSRKTLKQLYNMINKDFFPKRKISIYSGDEKLSDQNIETLTIADYFNITEEQLEGWAAARVAGTMAHQFPEQAIHISGQSLTLLIVFERKMPRKLQRK
jgi:hypothetical protein